MDLSRTRSDFSFERDAGKTLLSRSASAASTTQSMQNLASSRDGEELWSKVVYG